MIQKDYKQEIVVRYSEMDFDKSLKPFSLLNYFQDIASENAEKLGFGYSHITPKNLMWVLLKYRIEFSEYPVGISNLILNTEPRGCNKLFAYRDFELSTYDKLLARAFSMWALVDFTNMSIAPAASALNNPEMSKFIPREDDLAFEKIPQITKVDLEKEFEVRYNDIDVNRHANNGNYIIWALEPLSYEMKAERKLKTVDMVFKKEIKYGEKLLSQVQFADENTTIHAIKHFQTGDDLCHFLCRWI